MENKEIRVAEVNKANSLMWLKHLAKERDELNALINQVEEYAKNKEIYLRSNFLEIVKNYKDSGYYLTLLKQYHNLIKIDELWDREYFMIYQKKVVFLSYDDLKSMYFKEKVNVQV
ncbi:hypothetical protein RRG58_07880 [Mycoplasmopsis cynos]|nr:hypothetical protein [Mycoplasmopsis felis]WQQ11302.1 hypothetical protein RRG50_02525 [Mycoplasmopsis felis]WQQ11351.1 hypothetical protein RRG50_02780 [Mycoplasmopsis felis]WQQ11479.1 hypothetical protein RRG50_03460 [Mycoplasmopsis felis]WQQ11585.1 hypothetical protein RRG50_04065 [Mycoplasmopsis felis]